MDFDYLKKHLPDVLLQMPVVQPKLAKAKLKTTWTNFRLTINFFFMRIN